MPEVVCRACEVFKESVLTLEWESVCCPACLTCVTNLLYEFDDADTVSLVEGDGAAQAVQLP